MYLSAMAIPTIIAHFLQYLARDMTIHTIDATVFLVLARNKINKSLPP
jgi:hypothetical protein